MECDFEINRIKDKLYNLSFFYASTIQLKKSLLENTRTRRSQSRNFPNKKEQ
jgi:hypothetical protein